MTFLAGIGPGLVGGYQSPYIDAFVFWSHHTDYICEERALAMFRRSTFASPIVRDEDHGFIRHSDVDVLGLGEDREYRIGKVAFDVFLWADAGVAGADLFRVDDADSQGWCEAFCDLATVRGPGRKGAGPCFRLSRESQRRRRLADKWISPRPGPWTVTRFVRQGNVWWRGT